jgi:ABC-2 type transport system permease protein
MKLLAVTVKELKLLLRDPGNLLLLFLLPAVFILVLSIALKGAFDSPDSGDKITILVVNDDKGNFGRDLIVALGETGHFRVLTALDGAPLNEARCREAVSAGRYPVALLVPADMREGIALKKKKIIEIILDPTFSKEITLAFEGALKEFVHLAMLSGKMIEADKKGDAIDVLKGRIDDLRKRCESCESDLESLFARLKRGIFPRPPKSKDGETDSDDAETESKIDIAVGDIAKKDVEETIAVIDRDGVGIEERFAYGRDGAKGVSPNVVQQNVPGWTIFALFWIAQILMINILYERQSGAFKRVMASPISFPLYMLSKTVPFVLINLVQAVMMFAFGVYVLPLVGCPELSLTNLPALGLLTVAISLTAVAFGLMMASLSRTVFLSASVSATVLIIMTALGGIMVPRFVMPDVMQKMSLLVPHGWALEGYLDIIVRHQSTVDILPHVGVLLLFCVGFAAFAIARMHHLNRE